MKFNNRDRDYYFDNQTSPYVKNKELNNRLEYKSVTGKAYGLMMARKDFPRQDLMMSRQKQLLKNQTPAELRIAKLLKQLKISNTPQRCFKWSNPKTGGDFYIVDFFIPIDTDFSSFQQENYYKRFRSGLKGIVIECDGPSHKQQKGYDKKRTEKLQKHRNIVKVIRISNEQCLTITAIELKKLINLKEYKKSDDKKAKRIMKSSNPLPLYY